MLDCYNYVYSFERELQEKLFKIQAIKSAISYYFHKAKYVSFHQRKLHISCSFQDALLRDDSKIADFKKALNRLTFKVELKLTAKNANYYNILVKF